MAFIKEFKNIREELSEWEYLNSIGVRDMFHNPIKKRVTYLVIDRENNYFLIPQGHTGLARSDEDTHYYALCVDDKVINLEVLENSKGNYTDKNFEMEWKIQKVNFSKEWDFALFSKEKVCAIIEEAFIANSYNRVATAESVKSIRVDIAMSAETES